MTSGTWFVARNPAEKKAAIKSCMPLPILEPGTGLEHAPCVLHGKKETERAGNL